MNIEFNGKFGLWGPPPWFFVTIPAKLHRDLNAISGNLTDGWGLIPTYVRITTTEWHTSLFPKAGRYILPIE